MVTVTARLSGSRVQGPGFITTLPVASVPLMRLYLSEAQFLHLKNSTRNNIRFVRLLSGPTTGTCRKCSSPRPMREAGLLLMSFGSLY